MRVLQLSAFDAHGGAARSAYRLHRGLRSVGIDSSMLVRDKQSDDGTVTLLSTAPRRIAARFRGNLEHLLERFYPRRIPGGFFTMAFLPDGIGAEVRARTPDLVNLHWIGEGFVRPESLRRMRRPLVWTLHDTYAFTGGCHYPWSCERYTERCGVCPALGSKRDLDVSRINWARKRRAWSSLDLTIVTPSRWMASCAQRSSLFHDRRIEVIPYGLDTSVYRPLPRPVAREVLNLPPGRKLVLFIAAGGTSNPIKGFGYLAEALRGMAESGTADGVELVVAGASLLPTGLDSGVPTRCIGPVSDDVTVTLLYAAADAVVVPSVQENLANTVLEGLACGRPVIAFDIGGMPDMIRDRQNGALVRPFDIAGLAAAIRWVVGDATRWEALSQAARTTAEREYALEVQARRYVALYGEILDGAVRESTRRVSV